MFRNSKKSSGTVKLQNNIIIGSLLITLLFALINLYLGKVIIARSFLFGVLGNLLFLRMQVIYVNNFSKKDILSNFLSIISKGRIIIIAGVFFIAIRRTDLFDFATTFAGFIVVHLLSILVFFTSSFSNDENKKSVTK